MLRSTSSGTRGLYARAMRAGRACACARPPARRITRMGLALCQQSRVAPRRTFASGQLDAAAINAASQHSVKIVAAACVFGGIWLVVRARIRTSRPGAHPHAHPTTRATFTLGWILFVWKCILRQYIYKHVLNISAVHKIEGGHAKSMKKKLRSMRR